MVNIYNNIRNFLIDENVLVAVFNNYIYIYNYQKIKKLNNEEVIIKTNSNLVIIQGKELKLKKLMPSEIIISGAPSKVEFKNE